MPDISQSTLRRKSGPPHSEQARNQPGVHQCPGHDCRTLVSPGLIACRYHWLHIPKADRTALGDAFRQRTTNPDLYELAVTLAHHLINTHDPRKDPS